MITLQQLQVFCTVAENLNFTRAAEALNLTQPAVTFHIRALERYLGLRLFEVRGHQVSVTTAGTFLRQRAKVVLSSADAMRRDMQQFADTEIGWLKMGATLTIGDYVLADILGRFISSYPGIRLSVQIANTAHMEQALLARELDLALVEWRIASSEIEIVPFQTDELVVAVPRAHRLSAQGEVVAEDLVSDRFILREPGSGTRALALESLGPLAQHIDVILELGTTEAIKHAVQAGIGITIISRTIIAREVERGEICALRLAGQRMERDFSLAYLRGHVQSPAVRSFVNLIKERVKS